MECAMIQNVEVGISIAKSNINFGSNFL